MNRAIGENLQVLYSSTARRAAAQLMRTAHLHPGRLSIAATAHSFPASVQQRCVATLAMLRSTNTGRRLLFFGVPLALGALSSWAPLQMQSTAAWRQQGSPLPAEVVVAVEDPQPGSSPVRIIVTELQMLARSVYLLALFTPLMLLSPLCLKLETAREQWISLFCWTLERAGPAFMKWGQWAATRPDMFPPDLCQKLEKLQSNAPSHASSRSIAAVESSFGCRVEDIFEEFQDQPIASGSIAQVRKKRCLGREGREGKGRAGQASGAGR